MQTDVEAWGKRPLTKDMIYYASYDVVILIPELYNKLRRLVAGLANTHNHEYC